MRVRPAVRRFLVLALVVGPLGCNGYNTLFGLLEPHYTGGGAESLEKRRHFEGRIEAYQAHEAVKAVDAAYE